MSNKVKKIKKDDLKISDCSDDDSIKNTDKDNLDISDSSDYDSELDDLDEELNFSDVSIEEEVAVEEKDSSDEEVEYEKDSSDEDEDMSIHALFKLNPNLETMRNHPPDIKLKYTAMDLSFHPTQRLLATCNFAGQCIIYRYDANCTEKISTLRHHKKSCRKLRYSSDGASLASICEDQSIAFIDVDTSKISTHIKDAHDIGLSAVAQINDNAWATGDEDGIVKLWDVRQQKASFTFKSESEEEVVDFTIDDHNKYLVAAMQDCSVLPIRLKNYKPKEQTIGFVEHRCTSIAVMNEDSPGAIAVAACDSGKLIIFKYGTFILQSFGLIHSASVNCLLPYSDKKIITGSDDGKIRLAGVSPFMSYGVIGSTSTKTPIVSLAASNTDEFLASSSGDDKIQFWSTNKMDAVKRMRYNALTKKKNYRINEKIFKSSRTRSVGHFMRDMKSKNKFKDKALPPYSRDLE